MSKLLVVILSGVMFVAVGCKAEGEVGDDDSSMSGTSTRTESSTAAGADACTHCPGKQTKTADGMCSACNMKVK